MTTAVVNHENVARRVADEVVVNGERMIGTAGPLEAIVGNPHSPRPLSDKIVTGAPSPPPLAPFRASRLG